MTKYIIEIPDDVQYVLLNGQTDNKCYTAVRPVAELEVLNSDYINENFGELQDEAYQAGLNDAWNAAKKLGLSSENGGMKASAIREIFDGAFPLDVFMNYTAKEAVDKIKAYEDEHSDCIEVGDEVVWKTDDITLIVTSTYEVGCVNWCDGVAQDGKVYRALIENVRKTGKHYDIQSILEAMKS